MHEGSFMKLSSWLHPSLKLGPSPLVKVVNILGYMTIPGQNRTYIVYFQTKKINHEVLISEASFLP